MKNKKIKLLSILLMFNSALFAQNYLDNTAQWFQTTSWYGFTGNNNCKQHLYFNGDSIYNSLTYLKLYSDDSCVFNNFQYDSLGQQYTVTTYSVNTTLRGLFREAGHKFYMKFPTGISEQKVYDFTKGDYVDADSVAFNSYCGLGGVSMLMHDTICIGGIMRFRWTISMSTYPSATRFIEGVGPNSGFLSSICRNGCPECGYSLTNFILGNDTLYHGPCIFAGIDENDKSSFNLNREGATYILNAPHLKSVSIYDMQGRKITAFENIIGTSIAINTSTFAKGIYVFVINTSDNIYTRKIVAD